MSFNLLDTLKNSVGPDLVSKAAAMFGESESGITKTLGAGIPAILSGIISNAGADGGQSMLNLSKQAAGSGIADNPASLFTAGASTGNDFLSGIFGGKSGVISNLIASFTGVKQSTTNGLLGTLAPLALGFLGKHVMSNNLSAGGLLGFLNTQKEQVRNAMPAGLNLSSVLGDTPKVVHSTGTHGKTVVDEKTGAGRILIPLLLAVFAIALLWYLMKGCNEKNSVTETTNDTTIVAEKPASIDTTVAAATSARESLKVKLPDGKELDAFKGGIEDKLVAFLNDASSAAGKDVWFDFDDLNFKTGTAEIVPESQKQIDNISAILKAYPKVKIKIGGYTDKTGNEEGNKKLSQSRADAVKAALSTAGVGAQVTGAEGYGSSFAKYAADAPDSDRVKDRHVSISVREK
jgi:outer membrane protein OmpA-like peptidoglycan-associated protein